MLIRLNTKEKEYLIRGSNKGLKTKLNRLRNYIGQRIKREEL